MTCTSLYEAAFKRQLEPSDPLAGLNCTCYCAAMMLDYASCGTINTSGEHVRELTGDKEGGTRLSQIDRVFTHYGMEFTPYYGMDWDEVVNALKRGRSVILQGWYAVIRDSKFSGSETFGQNHAIFVPPSWKAKDPLADGRRPGLYKYHGEVYPQSLLRTFAAKLNVSSLPDSRYVPLGYGKAYVGVSQPHAVPKPSAVLPGIPASLYGVNTMVNQAGITVRSSHTVFLPKGAPLFRDSTGKSVVTKMSKAAEVDLLGRASPSYYAVRVGTAAFPDHVSRPVTLYAAIATAGSVKAKPNG